ncbi:ABC transporter permease [Candidatus Saccharibacteria bacterium]|jgi:ABC-2 type transport system permease protein|nr:ABC transporter permease [Candidatus Saccharibacteria bacterium]
MFKNLKKEALTILTFAKIETKRSLRDKTALFFTFVFPLIFLFVFGGIFGNDNSSVKFKVGLVNQGKSDFAKQFEEKVKADNTFEVNQGARTLDSARQKMDRDEIDATIILPESFGMIDSAKKYPTGKAEILYNKNSEQAAQTLSSVLSSVFNKINSGFVKTETPFSVESKSTAVEGQRSFDYTFTGLLGFSILSLAVFGPTNVFPQLKKRGVLKRYSTTTLKVRQLFIANALSYSLVGILSTATLFAAAKIFFKLNMKGDYLSLITLIVLGTFTLFGVGLAIGGWAKNENQAAPVAQIVVFPMIFLSGAFFPRFLMPEVLQTISSFLPLTPIIDGARLIITEGKTIFEIAPQVGLLAAWAAVIYLIAFRVFRWE